MKNTEQETLPSFASIPRSDSSDTERSGSNAAIAKIVSPIIAKRRGTGPRTIEGKKRSKQNSSKHRIFSKEVLLKDEPRAELKSMLKGLHDCLQPVGTLEIILVDNLASSFWRKRRLLIAETAEIQKGREFVEWDEIRGHETAAAKISSNGLELNGGLMREVANPIVLQRCLDLLGKLKSGIERDGFDVEWDKPILTTVYGEYREERWQDSLLATYLYWVAECHCSEEDDEEPDKSALEKCKNQFLQELEKEIEQLKRYQKDRESIESSRMTLMSLSRSVPESMQLDRLLRYGASLGREIERILKQLERLQRMRLGQPLPPSIDVNVRSEGE
jgi:hypothetical protein